MRCSKYRMKEIFSRFVLLLKEEKLASEECNEKSHKAKKPAMSRLPSCWFARNDRTSKKKNRRVYVTFESRECCGEAKNSKDSIKIFHFSAKQLRLFFLLQLVSLINSFASLYDILSRDVEDGFYFSAVEFTTINFRGIFRISFHAFSATFFSDENTFHINFFEPFRSWFNWSSRSELLAF